jgi:hypothetical protein
MLQPLGARCRAILAGATLLAAAAVAAEPPEREGLSCTLVKPTFADGLRLELAFANQTAAPIALPPGAHLVFYRDAAATEAMEATARADRIQRTPLSVPAHGRAADLFAISAAHTNELLCNPGPPAALGLYFYEFSRRPTFRCLLRQAAPVPWPMKAHCAPSSPAPSSPAPSSPAPSSPAPANPASANPAPAR